MSSGPLWTIEARKYDQRLHYRLSATLVDDDGQRMVFHTQPGNMLHHVTRGWTRPMQHPSDMFFWPGRWYNVYMNWKQPGELDHFYCNVGLPPVISDQTITFVDLDLDVQIWPDGRFQILDADEFAAHSALFGYPDDVREQARLAVLDILILWRSGAPPFNRSQG
ncbi:MAG: DUF402 domain-containing protein [Chloroflexi bacterium]|nr:DUF402 domain-containing protein [Chloroflexota bacterium]